MQLTLINNAAGARSYLGGIVTVAESDSTALPRDLNVVITQDSTFVSDVVNNKVIIDDGATIHGPSSAIELIKVLANFTTDPLATLFLYYAAPINIYQTATTAAGNLVWAMRNPLASNLSVVIERIQLTAIFTAGTPLVGPTVIGYDLIRFSAATPSGGTTVTSTKASSLAPASAVDVRYLDTGLTTTNVTFASDPFCIIPLTSAAGTKCDFKRQRICLKLAGGEGLGIRLARNAVVGQALMGSIDWSLR